jgi:hypothetical protein
VGCIARSGHPTLLADCDPRANVSELFLGEDEIEFDFRSIIADRVPTCRRIPGCSRRQSGLGPAGPGSARTSTPGRTRSARRSVASARGERVVIGAEDTDRGRRHPLTVTGNGGAGVVRHSGFSHVFQAAAEQEHVPGAGPDRGRLSQRAGQASALSRGRAAGLSCRSCHVRRYSQQPDSRGVDPS